MKYFAVIDSSKNVLRIVSCTEATPAGEGPNTYVEITEFKGWPTPPFKDSVLQCINGNLVWQDPRTLDQIKADKWMDIKAHRATLDYLPITVNSIKYSTSDISRLDFVGAIIAMQASGEIYRSWRCEDNVMRDLTLAQITTAGIAIANRRSALISTSATLFEQITVAPNAAAVALVTWPN